MKLEFTTTATCRPKILQATYASFTKNLLGINFKKSTLYINIDPIPPKVDPQAVVEVAKKFFGKVIVNIPKTPNFCQAIRWCWCQPKGYFFFHLEDDWTLNTRISMDLLKRRLEKGGKRCFGLNLRAYKFMHNRICLSPCLVKSKIAREIALQLNPLLNPEKQLRPRNFTNATGGKIRGYFNIHYPISSIITDIGRKWLKKAKYKRGNDINFITWSKR